MSIPKGQRCGHPQPREHNVVDAMDLVAADNRQVAPALSLPGQTPFGREAI